MKIQSNSEELNLQPANERRKKGDRRIRDERRHTKDIRYKGAYRRMTIDRRLAIQCRRKIGLAVQTA